MNILQITKKFPYPVIDGEVIAINNLTKGFSQLGHEVTVLALNTNKHYFHIPDLPVEMRRLASYSAVDINTDINPLKAFANLFTSKSYNIERFYSAQFERKIADLLTRQNFDLVLLEGIYLMRYLDVIRKNTKAKVALRPHNVEYMIWQRLYQGESNFLKKMYLKLLTARMKKFELENINRADLLLPVSETDMEIFKSHGCMVPYRTFPIGYELDKQPLGNEPEENAVAFIGAMDWMPNREGVEWFLEKIWGKVTDKIQDAKFYLAGRNFPKEIEMLQMKGLEVVGEVADAKKFILSKTVSIVPLLSGSGMRVKIIEAMALGRTIISTSVGAESIRYNNGEDILIADSETDFANAVILALLDSDLRNQMGANARELVNREYDNAKICSAIIAYCKSVM